MFNLLGLGKIREWASGKKSYLVIGAGIITGIAQANGVYIPEYVWTILGGLLGVTLKAGQNRVEQSTKELLEALKEAKNINK